MEKEQIINGIADLSTFELLCLSVAVDIGMTGDLQRFEKIMSYLKERTKRKLARASCELL